MGAAQRSCRPPAALQAELLGEPEPDSGVHGAELGSWRLSRSCKEVVGILDPDHALRFQRGDQDGLQYLFRSILIVVSADEELGYCPAGGKKVVRIVAPLGTYR